MRDVANLSRIVFRLRVAQPQDAKRGGKISGFGAEIAAQVSERAIDSLKAPILRLAGYDTPFPYALENSYLPSPERILRAVRKAMSY